MINISARNTICCTNSILSIILCWQNQSHLKSMHIQAALKQMTSDSSVKVSRYRNEKFNEFPVLHIIGFYYPFCPDNHLLILYNNPNFKCTICHDIVLQRESQSMSCLLLLKLALVSIVFDQWGIWSSAICLSTLALFSILSVLLYVSMDVNVCIKDTEIKNNSKKGAIGIVCHFCSI